MFPMISAFWKGEKSKRSGDKWWESAKKRPEPEAVAHASTAHQTPPRQLLPLNIIRSQSFKNAPKFVDPVVIRRRSVDENLLTRTDVGLTRASSEPCEELSPALAIWDTSKLKLKNSGRKYFRPFLKSAPIDPEKPESNPKTVKGAHEEDAHLGCLRPGVM
eukprot:1182103-Prorocentrum_minimum.AAC.3